MMNLKNNKKRIISLLIVFTMLIPIVAQALGLATIQLKIIDDESGINEILLPDGTKTTDTDIEYVITKNGFYKFTAYDVAGNIAQEFIIEVSDINENTNMDEIEDIINEAGNELDQLLDEDEKSKLEEQLNKVKEDYDDEIKSRLDDISESISNMISVDEEETIIYEIGALPEKYQSNKYTPSLEEEKIRLNQELQEKINKLINKNEFDIAKNAVEKAEKTLNQEDLNNARDKVNILNNETQKNELNERLDTVLELINKIKDIEKEIKDMEDLSQKNSIQDKIDKLPDGKEKDRLQQELNDKIEELEAINSGNKTLSEAIEAVKRAERTLQQIDLDIAWVKVKSLSESNDRNELSDRLNIVQELIFAIKQIEKGIDNMKSLEDESWIQREIDRLSGGSERNRLQKDLDNKVRELERLENKDKELQQAIEAVERAEKTITQRDVDRAWILVNRLPNSRNKDNLVRRLDRVQDLIDKKDVEGKDLEEAIKAVERVEVTLQQKDLDIARTKVNKLPVSIIKDSLNKRLDLVQKLIDGEKEKGEENEKLLEEVSDVVNKAEITMKDEDIQSAKDKTNQLPDGPRKEIFKERIELVEKIKAFKEQPEKQEENKPKEPEIPQVQEPNPDKTINSSTPPTTETTKIENEEDLNDNNYYKKPIREKQEHFFKLKEPKLPIRDDYEVHDKYEEVEDEVSEIEEIITKPKKSKLPIIIIGILLIAGAGISITLFIKNKNKEDEEDEEESYD